MGKLWVTVDTNIVGQSYLRAEDKLLIGAEKA